MAKRWPNNSLITTEGNAVYYGGVFIGAIADTGKRHGPEKKDEFWLSADGELCYSKTHAAYVTATKYVRGQ